MVEVSVTCPKCGEVQSNKDHLCARCGASLENKEQRRQRLAALEQSRRERERNDVSIQRLPGFGINGDARASFFSKEYFSEMSNQMRRRYVIVVGILVVSVVVFAIAK